MPKIVLKCLQTGGGFGFCHSSVNVCFRNELVQSHDDEQVTSITYILCVRLFYSCRAPNFGQLELTHNFSFAAPYVTY